MSSNTSKNVDENNKHNDNNDHHHEEDDHSKDAAMRRDQESKKLVLISTIESLCRGGGGGGGKEDEETKSSSSSGGSSEYEDIRIIADALKSRAGGGGGGGASAIGGGGGGGGAKVPNPRKNPPPPGPKSWKWKCQVIAGGATNYSYKVTLISSLSTTPATTVGNVPEELQFTIFPIVGGYDGGAPGRKGGDEAEDAVEVELYAKVCFPYALWNPDRSVHYDLKRVENEYYMMKRFANQLGGSGGGGTDGTQKEKGEEEGGGASAVSERRPSPIATPYFCVSVGGGGGGDGGGAEGDTAQMKVLICQWSRHADEQWANQFVDGECDVRIVPSFARALAKINSCRDDIDPSFNEDVRPCCLSLIGPKYKEMMIDLASTAPASTATSGEGTNLPATDKCVAYCRELGSEYVSRMVDGLVADWERRDVLLHNDSHVFNILCENKPSVEQLEKFGPRGSFVLCDWEMAMVGPSGKDAGVFMAWPLACALAHAMQGHEKEANHLLDAMILFWSEYSSAMKKENRDNNAANAGATTATTTALAPLVLDEQFLIQQFRSTMAWISAFLVLIYYILQINVQFLPLEGLSQSEIDQVMGHIGYLGLRLSEYGCLNKEPSLSLEGLEARFREAVQAEIVELLQCASGRRRRPRRASMLRASGRRVSDAGAMEAAAERIRARRASSGSFRASLIINLETSKELSSLLNEE